MAKRGVIDHPKFARLKVKLKVGKAVALGYLETLWQFTGRYTPQGNVGKYSDEEIEAWLEWDGEDGALIEAFVKCGWLDRDDTHRLLVHDWADHVDHTTKTALTRAGIEPIPTQPVSTNPTETEPCSNSVITVFSPPEPVPEPVPEPEPIIVVVPRADRAAWEEFCSIYPKRSGALNKAKAEPKFTNLARDHPAILEGVRRYRKWCDSTGKTGTEYVKQMDSWLNGKLWREEYEIPNGVMSLVSERDRILGQLHGT